jgi:L-asparagine transporter-like permease
VGCGIAAVLVAVNTAQVGLFGEARYWFALDQGARRSGVHRSRLAVIAGWMRGDLPSDSATCSTVPAGFCRNGWRGVWLALTLVITSYMGIEGVAVTAAKPSSRRRRSRARCGLMVLRLILFYVVAIAVMLMMTPWRELAKAAAVSRAARSCARSRRSGFPMPPAR